MDLYVQEMKSSGVGCGTPSKSLWFLFPSGHGFFLRSTTIAKKPYSLLELKVLFGEILTNKNMVCSRNRFYLGKKKTARARWDRGGEEGGEN